MGAASECLVGRIVVPNELITGGLSESPTLFIKGSGGGVVPDLKVIAGSNLIGSRIRSMGSEVSMPRYDVKLRLDPLTHCMGLRCGVGWSGGVGPP